MNDRIAQVNSLIKKGKEDVARVSRRELWLIGVALYWAEGSKQNGTSVSAGIKFGNSDVRMIKIFLKWLRVLKVPERDIGYELYVHDNRRKDVQEFRSWWAREIGVHRGAIDRVYFKRDKPKTNRTNVGDLYHGLLRIKVRSSTVLNRQIGGWVEGIVYSCRFV